MKYIILSLLLVPTIAGQGQPYRAANDVYGIDMRFNLATDRFERTAPSMGWIRIEEANILLDYLCARLDSLTRITGLLHDSLVILEREVGPWDHPLNINPSVFIHPCIPAVDSTFFGPKKKRGKE